MIAPDGGHPYSRTYVDQPDRPRRTRADQEVTTMETMSMTAVLRPVVMSDVLADAWVAARGVRVTTPLAFGFQGTGVPAAVRVRDAACIVAADTTYTPNAISLLPGADVVTDALAGFRSWSPPV